MHSDGNVHMFHICFTVTLSAGCGENSSFGIKEIRVQILALPLISCVNLDMILNFSEPHFSSSMKQR